MIDRIEDTINTQKARDNSTMDAADKHRIITIGLLKTAVSIVCCFVTASTLSVLGVSIGGLLAPFFIFLAYMGIAIFLMTLIVKHRHNEVYSNILMMLFGCLHGVLMVNVFAALTISSIIIILFLTVGVVGATIFFAKTWLIDSTGWSKPLLIGLVVAIIAMVVNIFLGSALLSVIISSVVILIMIAMVMHETQEALSNPHATSTEFALGIYLSFINIFIHLASIMGLD